MNNISRRALDLNRSWFPFPMTLMSGCPLCICSTCMSSIGKLILSFVVAALVFSSCKNHQTKNETEDNQQQVDPKQEFAKLSDFLKKFDEPSQTFKVSSGKPIKVTGKSGTILNINPDDLETSNGQPIGKEIQIELKELSSRQQLFMANAQTVSDGELIVTGGAYYINATSDGQQLKLKAGKTYSAEFPKLTDDDMNLYYGQRDSMNQMNWKKAGEKLSPQNPLLNENEPDSAQNPTAQIISYISKDTSSVPLKKLTKKEQKKIEEQNRIGKKVYSPISLNQFGWINCDMQLTPNPPRTQVQYVITNKPDEANYCFVYLIFQDRKAVMSSYYTVDHDKIQKDDFHNVPVGWSAKFLAVSYHNEKIFALLTDAKQIQDHQSENLTLKEMSEQDFDKMVRSIE